MSKKFNTDLDLQSLGKIINTQPATQAGDSVEYSQYTTALAGKQANLTDGQGTSINGTAVDVALSVAGSDYTSVTITGAAFASLDGVYTRASVGGSMLLAGVGDTQLDFQQHNLSSFYYKDNGNGTWSIVIQIDSNDNSVVNPTDQWLAVVTTNNPTTWSGSVIAAVSDYTAVDYDILGSSSDTDDLGRYTASSALSEVSYFSGTASGLKFANGKLLMDFATAWENFSSSKAYTSSVVHTKVEELYTDAVNLANHPFDNSTANFTGSPSNAQAAFESAAAEIDTLDTQVSGIQAVNTTQDNKLTALASNIGQALNNSTFVMPGNAGDIFLTSTPGDLNPETITEALGNIGDSFVTVYQSLGAINGLGFGEVDFGGGFVILPNNSNSKALFQAVESELQSLAAGAGATWPAGVVISVHESNIADLSNPGTDTFGGETLSQGQIFLAAGQTAQSENGFYVFDTSSTALVRWTEADESSEFIQNRSVQIVSDGTEWAYKGIADPTVGTNVLPFEKIRDSIVADLSVSEAKLDSTLASKINAKTDKHGEVVTLVADTWYQVTHNLDTLFVSVSTYLDSTGVEESYEVRIDDSNNISIKGTQAEDVRVVVIG